MKVFACGYARRLGETRRIPRLVLGCSPTWMNAGDAAIPARETIRQNHCRRQASCFVAPMPTPTPQPHVVNRRFFLRAAGVTLALPLLESLSPRVLGAGLAIGSKAGKAVGATRPRRLVCVGNMFGFYPGEFFPRKTGSGYEL